MSRSLSSKHRFGKSVSKGMVKAMMKPKRSGLTSAYKSAQKLITNKKKS